MTIAFAAAIGHAPGWVAWPERASEGQLATLAAGAEQVAQAMAAARPDIIIMLTSEHWTNFFLDHTSAFCIGRGQSHRGPVEPWMRMQTTDIPGDPKLAQAIIDAAYEAGIEPSFSNELLLDHGTVVPLKFLTPQFDLPVVPVFFNTLAPPQPSPKRCHDLGQVIGRVARACGQRVAIVATGGMSHDPGERKHGWIDTEFDRCFLEQMRTGDHDALRGYSIADLSAAGAGAVELIAWIALAGALGEFSGEVVAYEPVEPWATGMGIMQLQAAG